MYVSVNKCNFWWHGVHVECRARDLHDFLNVAWQTVDIRKAGKNIMKSEIMSNTTYKTHMKNVRVFDQEKQIGLKKMLNFCLIVYLVQASEEAV